MNVIEKRVWPEFFDDLNKTKLELRLADFSLKEGDVIVFKEWNPKTKKYTGRSITKKVKSVLKDFPTKFWSKEEIEKSGLYIL
jgi:hypothetical protein